MHLDRLGLSTLLGVIPGHLFRPKAPFEPKCFVEAEDRFIVVRIDNDQSRSGQARRVENVADVICQSSCPVTQAAFFRFLSFCRTGLSHTVAGRSQFRVAPGQRPGLAALASS